MLYKLILLMIYLLIFLPGCAGEPTEPEYQGKNLTEWRDQMLYHETRYGRSEAVRALYMMGAKQNVYVTSTIIRALDDVDWYVRKYAIEMLGELGDKSVIPNLMDELDDKSKKVGTAAIQVLEKLTGQDFGRDAAKWREWWEKNKASILKEEAEKDRLEKEKSGKE